MPLDENFQKTIIESAEDFKKLLDAVSESFDFSYCEFKLPIDLFEIIKNHHIEGIELLMIPKKWSEKESIRAIISPGLYISNIKFIKPVSFFDTIFNGPLGFQNVVFEKKVDFMSAVFTQNASFLNVDFNSTVIFRSIKANSSVSFYNSSLAFTEYGFVNSEIEAGLLFYNSTFKTSVDFSLSKINGALNFLSGEINGELNISNCTVGSLAIGGYPTPEEKLKSKEIYLSDSIFNGQVQLHDLQTEEKVHANNSIFNDSIFLTNTDFNNQIFFNATIFNKGIFINNVIINKHFSFAYSKFNQKFDLKGLSFQNADLYFTGVHIEADFWLGGNLSTDNIVSTSGTISFQGATISQNSIVRIFGINTNKTASGSIKFTNALIKGLLDIRNVFLNSISFEGTIVTGNIQDNNTLSKAIRDRNTARLLKHEAKKINNIISALSYYRIEMHTFSKTIPTKQYGDRAILFLNWVSNNYGLSWLRGILFTLGSGIILYSFFIMSFQGFGFFWKDDWNFLWNDKQFWSGFINFFWLPTGFNELVSQKSKDVNGGEWGALFFILGKIIIAYGIYQTVAAFRKYI